MRSFLNCLAIIIGLSWLHFAAGLPDPDESQPIGEVINRDVCIIGGGSSGTYAAVQLRDSGNSVVVVEKENVLGGHTNTFVDSQTNQTVDFGVLVFHNLQIVKDYFNRLNVSFIVTESLLPGNQSIFIDFNTGKVVPNFTRPDPTTGLSAYAAQVALFPQIQEGFFLPDPVPEELLLPFGEFVALHSNISNATLDISEFSQGISDFLHQPTLYVFKVFTLINLQDLSTGFLTTANSNNHEIYDNALQLLRPDVLLDSRVVSTDRGSDGVTVIVNTPSGQKTINAKKLLVAIPPKLDNLDGFDLDAREQGLFGQFLNSGFYTSLVNNTGIPAGVNIFNFSPDNPYGLPQLPGVYAIDPTVIPGVFDLKYGSPSGLPDDLVKANIISSLKMLRTIGIAEDPGVDPEFVAFKSHTPYELTVSTDAISSGFYKDLYALQGYRSTYYTGAAFHTQDSSLLWQFTESYVLPLLQN